MTLYYLFWIALYYAISVFHFFSDVSQEIIKFLSSIFVSNEKLSLKCVSSHINQLKRKPYHIMFIIKPNSVSYKDLVNLSVWCIAGDIRIISFYDYAGTIKNGILELRKEFELKGIIDQVYWGSSCSKLLSPEVQNGKQWDFLKLKINIYSFVDGKKALGDYARSNCETETDCHPMPMDLTAGTIEDGLGNMYGFQHPPDLVIYEGPVTCPYGALPFHMKVTEFLQIRSHRRFTASDFLDLLDKYSTIQQRLGS